jgi:hypothetical protein
MLKRVTRDTKSWRQNERRPNVVQRIPDINKPRHLTTSTPANQVLEVEGENWSRQFTDAFR